MIPQGQTPPVPAVFVDRSMPFPGNCGINDMPLEANTSQPLSIAQDSAPLSAASAHNPVESPPQVQRPIVFFDGVCGLCNRSVDFLLSLDRNQKLLFAPLQGETARKYLRPEQAEVRPADLRSIVYWEDGRGVRCSTAIVRSLLQIGGIWRLAGYALWIIPRPLRDWGYTVIASNRYRWFGKSESCRMPAPGERERFLP